MIDFTNSGFLPYTWGHRIPSVDVVGSNQVVFCFHLNGWDECTTHDIILSLEEWYTVEFTQKRLNNGQYLYAVTLNGNPVHSQDNTWAAQFNSVKIFAARGGYDPTTNEQYLNLDGSIRNLSVNPLKATAPKC